MSTNAMVVIECPFCKKQLQLDSKLSFASGPKSSAPTGGGDLEELLDAIDMDSLDDRAYEFVKKTKERYEEYGEKTIVSDKQIKWLRDLAGERF